MQSLQYIFGIKLMHHGLKQKIRRYLLWSIAIYSFPNVLLFDLPYNSVYLKRNERVGFLRVLGKFFFLVSSIARLTFLPMREKKLSQLFRLIADICFVIVFKRFMIEEYDLFSLLHSFSTNFFFREKNVHLSLHDYNRYQFKHKLFSPNL